MHGLYLHDATPLTYQPGSTHAHYPVGLALPPLTRFDLLQSNPVSVSHPRLGSSSQLYLMVNGLERAPMLDTSLPPMLGPH